MNKLPKIIIVSLIFCFGLVNIFAQAASTIVKKDLSQAEINRIIKTFTDNEEDFREALKNYVFNRSAIIQTVGLGGNISGEFRRDSFMTFSSNGGRFEKIEFAPVSTLRDLTITPEDLEDLGGVNPFALEPAYVNQYNFNYLGAETIDELELYVFDVSPKVIPDPKKTKQRMFIGRVWIDQRDLQMVKSKGKAVPETKDNKFPIVETWRENIDGKYWFPSVSISRGSDGELVFNNGNVIRMRLRVTYKNYRQGRSDVKILDDDIVVDEEPTPTPTPKKP